MIIISNIEVWKSYQKAPWIEVSTLGNVRTLDRLVPCGKGTQFVKGRVLKQFSSRQGYLRVTFSINGKSIKKQVHRLVAETFIPNVENLPQVNHKDCDRTNNCVSNLEWCTGSYNQKYREKYGVSNTEVLGRPLYVVNLKTYEVSKFPSQGVASRKLGVSQGNIYNVLKGQRKMAGGYWFTEDGSKIDKDKLHIIADSMQFRGGIVTVNLETLDVLRFSSQSEASRKLDINASNICEVLKGRYKQAGGYWFTNSDDHAVDNTESKFGDEIAGKVNQLIIKNAINFKNC